MHVRSTGEIRNFNLNKEFISEPATGGYMLVGLVGEQAAVRISDLNKIG
jgi:hypothetical protein